MKKIIILIILGLVVAGAAVYFLFLAPPPEPETSFYMPGEHFITNIKDSLRLLKVTVVLELNSTDPAGTDKYLAERNHVIRDIIVFTLRGRTETELRQDGIEDELRAEILAKLKSQMGLDYLQAIYFNDYVIQ